MHRLNVFSGTNAVLDFLRPDNAAPTPLVELPASLNPLSKDGVRIFAKLMNTLPLQNIKSLPAFEMLQTAQKTGKLKKVTSLIENSSGNTAFSLAVLGRLFGVAKTTAIVSHEVSRGKLQLLQLFNTGIQVNKEPICPDPNDLTSGIHIARRTGTGAGWFNPGQYDNEANPKAHYQWTGPQIWRQTGGEISVFCAGLGTTGTLVGAGGYLKKISLQSITTVGVVRSPNNPVPGVRTENLLHDIAFDWRASADYLEKISTRAAFKASLELCRAGIIAGPSSGFALAGARSFFQKTNSTGTKKKKKNKKGEVVVVFVCPDNPFPYLDEYFTYLPAGAFPKIKNEELLLRKPMAVVANEMAPEIRPRAAYKLYYDHGQLRPRTHIIDIRPPHEFHHVHLNGAICLTPQQVLTLRPSNTHRRGDTVILVCPTGERTKMYAQQLTEKGFHALSLTGGILEWSRLDLPRWRPNICIKP